jgi:hypothetical protein
MFRTIYYTKITVTKIFKKNSLKSFSRAFYFSTVRGMVSSILHSTHHCTCAPSLHRTAPPTSEPRTTSASHRGPTRHPPVPYLHQRPTHSKPASRPIMRAARAYREGVYSYVRTFPRLHLLRLRTPTFKSIYNKWGRAQCA